ncbi:MAG: hypothetical protein FWH02_05795 [Oscillospiraceae bacterium]|nr:hypothetical protein [Oscillospiraceae bacterium]
MATVTNLRPGVYSSYTVDWAYSAPRSRMYGAIAVKGSPAMAGNVYAVSSHDLAEELFSDVNTRLLAAVKIMLESGVSKVYAVCADDSLTQALDLLKEEDGIGAIVCDCALGDVAALKSYLADCAGSRREQIAFTGSDGNADALALAGALNDERAVVCCSGAAYRDYPADGLFTAAAMAGMMLSADDPIHNWNGQSLSVLGQCEKLSEQEIQALLAGGVTAFEVRNGETVCIRALTSRTARNGAPDRTMSPLNTVLIVDDVIRTVRDSLEHRLRGTRLSLDTVKSQVTVELSAKQDSGIIESFSTPSVRIHQSDPSACVVEMAFKAANVLSQIHITAFVRI